MVQWSSSAERTIGGFNGRNTFILEVKFVMLHNLL